MAGWPSTNSHDPLSIVYYSHSYFPAVIQRSTGSGCYPYLP